jgi:serine/threonine-protein kinase RsbW
VHKPPSLRVESAALEDLATIRGFVRQAAGSLLVDEEVVPDLVIATDEAATNIIRHGYRGRGGPIEVEVERVGDSVVIRLRDEAPVFDPTTRAAPDLLVPLEQRPTGGLGIHLARSSVDRMVHRRSGAGNELTLVKRLAPDGRDGNR